MPYAVLVYYLWWDKPYDVVVPTVLHVNPENTPARKDRTARLHGTTVLSGKPTSSQTGTYLRYGILTRIFANRLDMPPQCAWVSCLGPVAIGAVHLAAWNLSLPTPFERAAWRVCSVIVFGEVPLYSAIYLICHLFSYVRRRTHSLMQVRFGTTTENRLDTVATMGFIVYAIARLFLIVEAFVGLRAAPKLVYKTPEWEKFLPHFG